MARNFWTDAFKADKIADLVGEPASRTRREEIEYQRYCVAECEATIRREPWNASFAALLVHHKGQLAALGSPIL